MTKKKPKYYKRVAAKPNQLLVKYGKDDAGDNDLCFSWGDENAGRADSRLVMIALSEPRRILNAETMKYELGNSVIEELAKRGYDITTLRFSVMHRDAT